MRPVLFLGALAAAAPTALLLALRGSSSFIWYGPGAHAVLCWSIAVLALTVAHWLAREAKLAAHPSVGILSAGYTGLAAIFATEAFAKDPAHFMLLGTLSLAWIMAFGAFAITFLTVHDARRRARRCLTAHPVPFFGVLALVFAGLCGAAWLLDGPVFHSPTRAAAAGAATFVIVGVTIPVLLVLVFLVYWSKRNPVILFFTLGLYLYALATVGRIAAPQWSLPWWYSQGLSLISVFAVAYGVVEANHVRDRLELIRTLAARSHELQQSHADLAYSEMRYRSLVNNAPHGIFRLNHFERFEAVNPALLEVLGYDPLQPAPWLPLFADCFREKDDHTALMQSLRRVGRAQEEVFWKRRDGTAFKVRLQCRRVPGDSPNAPWFEGIVEDLSAQSSLEEQLRQSQKMEAIGRLAGGIAHDFNNLLTIIHGYTGMLIETLSESDPRRADAQRVKHAAQQAATLTRQLLAFSRKQVLSPARLNLNTVVSDLSKILPRLLGEDVDLAFVPDDHLAWVHADRGQVEQVLMNLIVNARDAMPAGGKITVETRNEKLDEKYTRRRGVVPGEYVMLAVTDTGCGMDDATKARIFEPFFTTKEEGKGTGLGLATAYGIVKQSGGHIAVYSEPGQGTTLKVYFPATSISRETEKEIVPTNRAPRGETILVVEDEADVRNMIVRALTRIGYRVLEAASGEDALEMLIVERSNVQLLITDIVMPGLRGTDVAQKLSALVPGLRIIYMSGYTDNAMFHQKLLDAGAAFIQKPFTLEVLEDRVTKTLEQRTRTVMNA
jgi:two-component system cell cycle sensor histidine kinase/response regulator CckA